MRTLAKLAVAIATASPLLTVASGATLTTLFDNFTADSVDLSKWNITNRGLEQTGNVGYNAPSTTTTQDLLTLGGTAGNQYWYGSSLESVDNFSSSLQTTISVQRVSLAGTGSAFRSSLWLLQPTGQYLHYSQNVGEGGWSYNPTNSGNSKGEGIQLSAFDGQDNNLGSVEMKLVYRPLGGTNAAIDIYLDNVLGTTRQFTDWDNSLPFNVILTGQARATGDTVTAKFDNFSVQAVPEPASAVLLGLSGVGLLVRRRRA